MEDLDAVSVCTWNSVHAGASIAALKAGKHVLCEKTLGHDCRRSLRNSESSQRIWMFINARLCNAF